MAQLIYAWRLLRELILGHFWIPVALTVVIDTLIGLGTHFTSNGFFDFWYAHASTLLVHSAVFISVFSILLVRQAGVSVCEISILDDILPDARFLHAFGMIP